MNVLITGANGQLGKELKLAVARFNTYNYFFTAKNELDITNFKQSEAYIKVNKINAIINCAAYTNVEKAEDEFNVANKINNLGVKNLAEISKKYTISLIHISTDYVFNGKNKIPYLEESVTDPINNYGKSKLQGEEAIIKINPKNTIIIRTSWLYSRFNSNFVKTMLKLGTIKEEISVIDDQFGSPTNAKDLADAILTIIPKINNKNVVIYHYSNTGSCSWFKFAEEIMKLSKSNCKVKPIHSNDYPTKAKRPKSSLLAVHKIKTVFNISIPSWQESLKKTIENLQL